MYVRNKDLLEEISKCRKKGKYSNKFGRMVMLIAENYSSKGNFSGYTWREDMVSEAISTVFRYIHNFNEEKSKNPFSYITRIVHNTFISFITKQKKQSEIKDYCFKNLEHLDDYFYVNKGIDYTIIKENTT